MKERWQTVLQKLKNPPAWALALTYVLTVFSCAGAIALAVIGAQTLLLEILSYILYALAALTLAYSVYTVVIFAPKMKRRMTALIKKTKFGRKMLEHYGFRTVIFAACALIFNIAYVAFHIVLAIMLRSFWYGSLAAYYGMLVALRSGVVLYHKKRGNIADVRLQQKTELTKYRTCGVMLTIIPLCLVIPILQILFLDKAFIHEGWTVIAFAAYAFYKIVMAIVNVVKSQKQTDFTVRAIRNIAFADALVSIFSLQTALLYSFAAGGDYRAANLATGSAVCLITIALGVIMIVKANKKTRELKEEE